MSRQLLGALVLALALLAIVSGVVQMPHNVYAPEQEVQDATRHQD